jgi:hypothetical protein
MRNVAREDFRWITVGGKSQPGVAIVLTNYLNGSPADRDALQALLLGLGTPAGVPGVGSWPRNRAPTVEHAGTPAAHAAGSSLRRHHIARPR